MEEKTTIKRKIKKIMHVLNPLAGKGRASKIKGELAENNYVYMTQSPDEATTFIEKECKENPDTCFTVYGGDGTVFKAVNALMKSGCADRASLKIVPVGSGNDFVKSFAGEHGEKLIDVMKFNDKYAANVINMGFDCNVVIRAQELKKKPLVSGPFSYILGVMNEAFHKTAMDMKAVLTYADGTTEEVNEHVLLMAVANARWYGGGFQAAPAAKVDDGLLDVVIVKDVSIATFLSLVGDYKKGTHVNVETLEVKDSFKDYMMYKRVKAIHIEGCKKVCADGEIFEEDVVDISVCPQAIDYIID